MAQVVFLVLAVMAMAGSLGTMAYTFYLAYQVRKPGLGRVLFCSLASLKLWVVLVFTFFFWNAFGPLRFEVNEAMRFFWRTMLAVYLVIQSMCVALALERWRRGSLGNPRTWWRRVRGKSQRQRGSESSNYEEQVH